MEDSGSIEYFIFRTQTSFFNFHFLLSEPNSPAARLVSKDGEEGHRAIGVSRGLSRGRTPSCPDQSALYGEDVNSKVMTTSTSYDIHTQLSLNGRAHPRQREPQAVHLLQV